MKVVLVNPPYGRRAAPAGAVTLPLGLAYITSYLLEAGIPTQLVDCTPRGLGMKQLEQLLIHEEPDIFGITATTPMINAAIQVSRLVKSLDHPAWVVLGGPHASAFGEQALKQFDTIDIIVRGEGEHTMLELIKELEKAKPELDTVAGISYQKDGSTFTTPARPLIEDIDSLPFPYRDPDTMKRYRPSIKWYHRMPFTTMITARGCPFRCAFCSCHLTFGRKARLRSAENVVREIEELVQVQGVRELIFYDDTFTLNKKRVHEICDLLLERNIDITWGCLSRVDTVDEALLRKMRLAGCHMISFGVESGSDTMLQIMKKGTTSSQARSALALARNVGISTTATFIVGVPGETRETLNQTINFAGEVNPTFAEFFRLIPYPGTEFFDTFSEQNISLTKI